MPLSFGGSLPQQNYCGLAYPDSAAYRDSFIQTCFFLLSGQKYFMATSLRRPLVLNTIGEL